MCRLNSETSAVLEAPGFKHLPYDLPQICQSCTSQSLLLPQGPFTLEQRLTSATLKSEGLAVFHSDRDKPKFGQVAFFGASVSLPIIFLAVGFIVNDNSNYQLLSICPVPWYYVIVS